MLEKIGLISNLAPILRTVHKLVFTNLRIQLFFSVSCSAVKLTALTLIFTLTNKHWLIEFVLKTCYKRNVINVILNNLPDWRHYLYDRMTL